MPGCTIVRALVRTLAAAAGLALLAAPALADQAGLAHAHEVLRQMRALRAAQADPQISPLVVQKFGHHVKKPPPPEPPPPPPEERERFPDVNPTGTLQMGGQIRVVVGTAAYAVGDEIEDGWRVGAITPKTLTLRKGARTRDYKIR